MAIEKAIETPDGVRHEAAYWRVAEVNADMVEGWLRVRVDAFHSSAAARAGRNRIAHRWYEVEGERFDTFRSQVVQTGVDLAYLYELIKGTKDVALPAKRDDQYEPGEARLPDMLVGFFDDGVDV